MNRHITVNGVPWCDACSRPFTFGIASDDPNKFERWTEKDMALSRDMKARGVLAICMGSKPDDEAAVALLREHGINAELTEGACPATRSEFGD